MRGGVTSFRSNGGAAARTYLEKDTSRPDDYYLKEGSGLADHWVLDGSGSLTSKEAVDGDAYEAWVDWTDLETGESKGKPRTTTVVNAKGEESIVPSSPRFQEMTVNCDKTLSIAAALHPEISAALDAAQEDAARTMLEYLATHSQTRVGPKGAQEYVGAEKLEAMSVVHHTNREGDPHRHIHLQVSTRVFAQGTWRGLDGSIFYRQQGVLRGLGEAAIAANPQLRQALAAHGFTFDPLTGAVVELAEYREVLSKRAVQIQAHKAQFEAQWRAEHPGMEPGPRVVRAWDRMAWAENRPDKTPDTMPSEALWRAELEAAGYKPPAGPANAPASMVGTLDRDGIAAEAVALAQAKRSTWSVPDLGEHVAKLVAASGIIGERAVLVETVEDITARAVALCSSVAPDEWQEGGLPTGYRHLTSAHVVRIEREIGEYFTYAALLAENPSDLSQEVVERMVSASNQQQEKGKKPVTVPDAEGQRAALRAMSGNHRLVVVTGAAGSGKTTVLIAAKAVVDAQKRQQMLVAPTMKAAQVAGTEVGSPASSVHKLLRENGWRWDSDDDRSWHRLALGEVDPTTGAEFKGVKPEYQLSAETQLVVDESGMLSQETAHKLLELAHEAGSQVVLLGDRAQLAAVGRGGVLDMAAKTAHAVIDLDKVHRFTDPAYAEVSLMMREHTNLDAAFDHLVAHDLVQVHKNEDEALAVVATQYLSESAEHQVALTVATNSEATALNEAIRESRLVLGEVSRAKTTGSDGLGIGKGDLVMVRQNNTQLGVANRETFTVKRASTNGSLIVADPDGKRFTLPAEYVAEHVHLGYAVTGHGNQGITTTTSHTLLGDGTDAAGAYVGMTRGREANTLHLVANDLDEAREQFMDAFARDNADRGLAAARLELAEQLAPYRPTPPAAPVVPLTAQEMSAAEVLLTRGTTLLSQAKAEAEFKSGLEDYRSAVKAWKDSGKLTPKGSRLAAQSALRTAETAEQTAQKLRETQLAEVAETYQTPTYRAMKDLQEAKAVEANAGLFKRSAARAQVSAAETTAQVMAPGIPLPENINDREQVIDWRRAAIRYQQAQAPVTEEQLALQIRAQEQRARAQELEASAQELRPAWQETIPTYPVEPAPRVARFETMEGEKLNKYVENAQKTVNALENAEADPEAARLALNANEPKRSAAATRVVPARQVTQETALQDDMNPIHDQQQDGPTLS